MKKKHKMIVIFSIFLLLIVIIFGLFVYRVSKRTEHSSQQPERQIKKIEVNFFALDPHDSLGKVEKMEALFEIEKNRIVFDIEVEKFKEFENGGYFREQKWVDGLECWQVAYNIKTPLITTFWKGGKKNKNRTNTSCL